MKIRLFPARCAILALVIALLQPLSGFTQDNPLFAHLPPDAVIVFHINLPALNAKVSWKDVAQLFPQRKNNPDRHDQDYTDFFRDPTAAGIDIGKDVFITDKPFISADSPGATTVILHLQDSGKFVGFLRKESGLRFFTYPGKGRTARKNRMAAAWNQEIAVLTFISAPATGTTPAPHSGPGTHPTPPAHSAPPVHSSPTTPAPPAGAGPEDALQAARASIAALTGFSSSPFISDPLFRSDFSDDADFHIWAPPGKGLTMLVQRLSKLSPGKSGIPAFPATTGNAKEHTITTIRFETGRLTIRSHTRFPSDTLANYAKIIGRPLNSDLIARLPKGDLLALASLHFDMSAIGGLLDRYGLRSKVDSQLSAKEISISTVLTAFKGDFLLAALGPDSSGRGGGTATDSKGTATDSTMQNSGSPARKQPSLFFVTEINDQTAFTKLAMKWNLIGDSTNVSSVAKPPLVDRMKSAYTLRDNILVISDSKARTEAFFNPAEKRNTDFVTRDIQESPLSIWINFKTVANFLKHMKSDGGGDPQSHAFEKNQQALYFLAALDQLTITLGTIHDGQIETSIELKMTDSSENSLRTLFHLVHP